MAWFAVDDGFDTHPKIRKAGNPAAGLFVRLGTYAARHLTDGHIPGIVARDYGTAAQLRKLTEAGMLHSQPHTCDRCEQPAKGDYVMHDYLEYNRSRKQIEAARENGRKRQQKGRARQAQQRDETKPEAQQNPNRDSPEPHPSSGWTSNASQPESLFQGSVAGHEGSSRRDTLQGDTVVPSQPSPSSPPEEEKRKSQLATRASTDDVPRIGDRPRIPDSCQPLVAAVQAARLYVGWDLNPAEWFLIEALVRRCGIPALVVSANASWQGARSQPRNARYFIPAWRTLPDALPTPEPVDLPAAVGEVVPLGPAPHTAGARPSTTDARVQQALDAGRRLQALADAQNAQENQ